MLPKKYRFESFEEIEKVKKEGQLYQNRLFGLLVLKNRTDSLSRFAIIVSLKISKKATERNRSKRILSEVISSFLPLARPGFSLVFLVKKLFLGKSFSEVKRETESVFKKIGLVGSP